MSDKVLEIKKGIRFRHQRVRLDGNDFIGCTFDDCVLEIGGGLFVLGQGNAINNARIDFVDNATTFLMVLEQLYREPGLRPVVERLIELVRTGEFSKNVSLNRERPGDFHA